MGASEKMTPSAYKPCIIIMLLDRKRYCIASEGHVWRRTRIATRQLYNVMVMLAGESSSVVERRVPARLTLPVCFSSTLR